MLLGRSKKRAFAGAPGCLSWLMSDFGSGHDFTVVRLSPASGSAQSLLETVCLSLSLCPFPAHVLSLSFCPKERKKERKKEKEKEKEMRLVFVLGSWHTAS